MVDLALKFDVEDAVLPVQFAMTDQIMPLGFDKVQMIHTAMLQEKTVVPSDGEQVITPDSGYDGLSRVVVGSRKTPADVEIVKTGNRTVNVAYPSSGDLVSKAVGTAPIVLEGLNVGDVVMIYFYGGRSGIGTGTAVSCSVSAKGCVYFLAVNKSYYTGSGSSPYIHYYKVYLILITSESAEITVTTT